MTEPMLSASSAAVENAFGAAAVLIVAGGAFALGSGLVLLIAYMARRFGFRRGDDGAGLALYSRQANAGVRPSLLGVVFRGSLAAVVCGAGLACLGMAVSFISRPTP
ncbi:MAG: hypothetical protein AAF968_20765 [Pseudomonadota bacterium]